VSRSQRDKGSRGELEARDVFLASGVGARRSANQACREPGDPDLALDVPGWFVEVKNGRGISIPAAVRQARAAAQRRHAGDRVIVYAHWTAEPGERPVRGIFVPDDGAGTNFVAAAIAKVARQDVSPPEHGARILGADNTDDAGTPVSRTVYSDGRLLIVPVRFAREGDPAVAKESDAPPGEKA
jgi:hypothetical protein